jgi:signal transduction histidine kinase
MRERAHTLGGSLEIKTAPSEGTCVEVCMPINANRRYPR